MLSILFGAVLLLLLIIFVAISEYNIAKQDKEWLKEFREDDTWKEK